MDNPQQYYPQTPLQQMPPVKKTKPLYKKWWFWTFMVCNAFVIGILFLSLLAAVDENLKYQAALQEANLDANETNEIQLEPMHNPDFVKYILDRKIDRFHLLNKSFNFSDFLAEDSQLVDFKALSHLAVYNYLIQYNIFYHAVYENADIVNLIPLAKKYNNSIAYCVSTQYQSGNISKEEQDFFLETLSISSATIIKKLNTTEKKLSEDSKSEVLASTEIIDETIEVIIKEIANK